MAGGAGGGGAGGGRVEQLEGDLEERVAAEVAFGLQLLDELFEGEVLVGVGAEGDVVDAGEQLAEGGVAGEVGAQDERVDEEADQRLELGAGAVRDRDADDDVVLAGVAVRAGPGRRRAGP